MSLDKKQKEWYLKMEKIKQNDNNNKKNNLMVRITVYTIGMI